MTLVSSAPGGKSVLSPDHHPHIAVNTAINHVLYSSAQNDDDEIGPPPSNRSWQRLQLYKTQEVQEDDDGPNSKKRLESTPHNPSSTFYSVNWYNPYYAIERLPLCQRADDASGTIAFLGVMRI
ncbi:hypothetical protein [Chitinophaga lutea]